jgi:uncharacterized membrane protein YtjA (UPF0391 family)
MAAARKRLWPRSPPRCSKCQTPPNLSHVVAYDRGVAGTARCHAQFKSRLGCQIFCRTIRADPGSALADARSAKERAMNFGNMLYWALIFLVIAIVAGVLGFGGVAGTASEVAHVLFWIAIILLIVSLVFGLRRR